MVNGSNYGRRPCSLTGKARASHKLASEVSLFGGPSEADVGEAATLWS